MNLRRLCSATEQLTSNLMLATLLLSIRCRNFKYINIMPRYISKDMTVFASHGGKTRSGNTVSIIELKINGLGTKTIGTVFCTFQEIVKLFQEQKKDIRKHSDFKIPYQHSYYNIYNCC